MAEFLAIAMFALACIGLMGGYNVASGSIAASGTLGQIIPPSIVLVILGDQMSNAYQEAQALSYSQLIAPPQRQLAAAQLYLLPSA